MSGGVGVRCGAPAPAVGLYYGGGGCGGVVGRAGEVRRLVGVEGAVWVRVCRGLCGCLWVGVGGAVGVNGLEGEEGAVGAVAGLGRDEDVMGLAAGAVEADAGRGERGVRAGAGAGDEAAEEVAVGGGALKGVERAAVEAGGGMAEERFAGSLDGEDGVRAAGGNREVIHGRARAGFDGDGGRSAVLIRRGSDVDAVQCVGGWLSISIFGGRRLGDACRRAEVRVGLNRDMVAIR